MNAPALRDMGEGEDCCRLGRGCVFATFSPCRFEDTARFWYETTYQKPFPFAGSERQCTHHEDIG